MIRFAEVYYGIPHPWIWPHRGSMMVDDLSSCLRCRFVRIATPNDCWRKVDRSEEISFTPIRDRHKQRIGLSTQRISRILRSFWL